MRPKDLKTASELSNRKPHGTRIKYLGGCRCVPCRAANSSYQSARFYARRCGDFGDIVSAVNARNHLADLAKSGIGLRSVRDISKVGRTTLSQIRKGTKTHIRMQTEKKILSVSMENIKFLPKPQLHKIIRERNEK